MPLQIRLRHPLGERVLDLPDRTSSEPLVIGRAREADIQIPSTGIAPQHGFLFTHEGQWVVQPTDGVITVNGRPILDPTALQIGDVLGFGSEPAAPTLEIDPLAAAQGKTGPAQAVASAARPSAGPASGGLRPIGPNRPASQSKNPSPLRRIGAGHPVVPASAPADQAVADNAATDDDAIEWGTGVAATNATWKKPAKAKGGSQEAAAVAVVVGLGILIGVGYVAYSRAHTPPPAPVVAQAPPVAKVVVPQRKSLFDLNADQAEAMVEHAPPGSMRPAVPAPTDRAASPAPAVAPVPEVEPAPSSANAQVSSASLEAQPPEVDQDKGPDDDAWNEIKGAHYDVRHQGLAIIKFDEYRRAHPGVQTAKLDQYTEAAVNWLWWQRIAVLWKQRAELDTAVRQNATDQHSQPEGDFRKTLQEQKADLQARLDKVTNSLLTEMGYTADLPPNLESPTDLQELAAKRDPTKYADFKRHILHYVRDNHGATWWDGE